MLTPISLFDYNLPVELIALKPSKKRDECRLLFADRASGEISHHLFKSLKNILSDDYFLVLNNTKVHNARLYANKVTGGKCELFVTEVLGYDKCKALARGKFKAKDNLIIGGKHITLLEKDNDGVWLVDFHGESVEELMQRIGHIPLPPYINRIDDEDDKIDYQTVFSKSYGSVAAPTAALHFTEELLTSFEKVELTLNVGLGTFRPVKTEYLEEHIMHTEKYHISESAANRIMSLKRSGKKLIAVGTTVVRALESATNEHGELNSGFAETNILIKPPYKFKMVDGLITNFHLPKSTLMALVSAFAGVEFTKNIYDVAINERYRFFSYGDATVIL